MKMKNVLYISFLLIYISSLFSFKSLHFHEHETQNHRELSSCEKSIDNSKNEKTCIHNSHFENIEEKCFACDNHVYSPHFKNTFSSYNIFNLERKEYIQINSFFSSQKLICKNNKSPPSLS